METISVFGLGKLGCTMLSCFAHKGWDVIGVDVLPRNVKCLNDGESPIYEPGVAELIKAHKERIHATCDPVEATQKSDVSFIIVPTPSDPEGFFITQYVKDVASNIALGLKNKTTFHLIVVTSTVLPGAMEEIENLITEISGKKCGHDYGLCYNPDFIAIGRIVHDFLNPDMVLIGYSDPASGRKLQDIHERLVRNKPEFHLMSYYNAELAKITLNSFCTMKITFANMVAEICEKMPKGNAFDVLNAVGADSRVGKKYLRGGLGYGGPCFPRDNRAFMNVASRYGALASLPEITDAMNDYHKVVRIPAKVLGILKECNTKEIAVMGLAYKEDTVLVEESASLALILTLLENGIAVTVYDPCAMADAKRTLGDRVKYAGSIEGCLRGQKVCFIGTPWKEFKALYKNTFLLNMVPNPIIVDAWNLYDFQDVTLVKIGQAG